MCAAFSPDGGTLATGQQFGPVTLWDTTTGQPRIILQQKETTTCDAIAVAFSSNGKLLAAGNSEGIKRLWNVETGQLKVSFKGHTEGIRSVAFSPDVKTWVSGSGDKTARLWDVVTGQELLTLKGHKFPVHLVAFAPDSKRIATASHNEVKLWLAATEPEATAFRMELDPDDADSPRAANLWGDRLVEINQLHEAQAAYGKAQTRLKKLVAALPNIPDYRQELAYSLVGTALLTSNMEQGQIAEQVHRRLRDIDRTLAPDQKRNLAEPLHRRGHAYGRLGRWNEAAALFTESIELAPDNPQWRTCRRQAYLELEDWPKAAEDLAGWVESPDADGRVWYEYALL